MTLDQLKGLKKARLHPVDKKLMQLVEKSEIILGYTIRGNVQPSQNNTTIICYVAGKGIFEKEPVIFYSNARFVDDNNKSYAKCNMLLIQNIFKYIRIEKIKPEKDFLDPI